MSRLFGEVVRRVEIPETIADWIAEALRESQADKERFHRTAVMRLQQRYLSVQAKLDRAYEDRLAGKISDELWLRKSGEWEEELELTRRETAKHEQASHDYAVTGSKILELAKNAHRLFVQQNPTEQARLLKTLLSNCTFDRGSLCPTYTKPFDLLVEGNESGAWLGGRDSNPDNVVQRADHGLRCASIRVVSGGSCERPLRPLPSLSLRSRAACLIESHLLETVGDLTRSCVRL